MWRDTRKKLSMCKSSSQVPSKIDFLHISKCHNCGGFSVKKSSLNTLNKSMKVYHQGFEIQVKRFLWLQVMRQKHNRHVSISLYISAWLWRTLLHYWLVSPNFVILLSSSWRKWTKFVVYFVELRAVILYTFQVFLHIWAASIMLFSAKSTLVCAIATAVLWAAGLASTLFILSMTFDRFYSIIRPHQGCLI